MEGVRLDKWLWAARFFKTRPHAAKACELGRVQLHSLDAKPSREVRLGDQLRVRTEGGLFVVTVRGLSDVRGPAPVARALYEESEESRVARQREQDERRALAQVEILPAGRPSKRNRRELARIRGRS